LDQGNLGSCTGNATVNALGTNPLFQSLPQLTQKILDESLAKGIYSDAEVIDGGAGLPDEDEGSSGLSAAKAAKARGLISGYTHATSLNGVLTAMQAGPVITGVNWYEGFDSPNSAGVVHVSGQVRGGHEFVLLGCDISNKMVLAMNSWGNWGLNGTFTFSFDDYTRLLSEQGDATYLVPITAPAPTPAPP